MTDQDFLRAKAREQVRAGRLSSRGPDRTLVGTGSGQSCAVCSVVIARDRLEYEIHVRHDGAASRTEIHHFHLPCFAAWSIERAKLEGASG
jgi:hypothetical protein